MLTYKEKEMPGPGSGGFSLVELLIAMLVGGVIMASVMTSFQTQHRTYMGQDQVVELQQNARAAMDMIARDIRSAGYDPHDLGAGITMATAGRIEFSRSDGTGSLETIAYSLFDSNTMSGGNEGDLMRQNGASTGAVAENIRFLEFRYLDDNGNPTTVAENTRAVQVSILAQSARRQPGMNPHRPAHTTPGGQTWQADNGFFSRFFTTTIVCRNLGL